jgi:hypothetical protein
LLFILSETEVLVHSQSLCTAAALYHRVIGGAVEIHHGKPFNLLSGNHSVFDAFEAIIAQGLRHEIRIIWQPIEYAANMDLYNIYTNKQRYVAMIHLYI